MLNALILHPPLQPKQNDCDTNGLEIPWRSLAASTRLFWGRCWYPQAEPPSQCPALFPYLKRCLAVVVSNLLTCTTKQKNPSTTLLWEGQDKRSVRSSCWGEERRTRELNFGAEGEAEEPTASPGAQESSYGQLWAAVQSYAQHSPLWRLFSFPLNCA